MTDTGIDKTPFGAQAARAPARALGARLLLPAALLALVLMGPWLFDSYLLNVLVKAFFFAVVAVTVDLLWGYTGYLTFGQAAFFGVGAYAAGLVFTHLGFSPGHAVLAMALAAAGAAAIAALVGWLSFYRGASPFFATVISLVLPIVVSQLLLSGGSWTGSSSGLTGYGTFDLSLQAWFWIAGSAALAVGLLGWRLAHSDAGRVLAAIRDNETRCAYLGIDVPTVKILLLIACAALAGLAGFGYGAFSGVVAPELAGFALGTELIIWVALGGRGTLWGPLLGAILINVGTAYLSGSLPFAWPVVLGAAFVLVIVLLPQGLVPVLLRPFGLTGQAAPAPALAPSPARAAAVGNGVAIELADVHKRYGSLKVLEGIDLSAHEGELVGLIGPNGAGKTTLMRCMSDGAERTAGTVRIGGHDIGDVPPQACVRLGLGRKFQNANVFESLTVAECLRMARCIHERPLLLRRRQVLHLPPYALDVLCATGLDKQLGTVTRDLSHGQQQALELATVLALEPRVVLLDEPTAGLTKAERTQIGRVLASLAVQHQLCCLLVEHDLDFVQEIATCIVVMHQGRIVMKGSFEEVAASELVRTIYVGADAAQGAHR